MKLSKFTAITAGTLLFSSALFLGSCKKDKKTEETTTTTTTPPPAPTNTEKLTGKNFKLTAWTVNPGIPVNGTTVTDVYAQLDACTKDDIMNFTSDKKYTVDEGASKCNASDPQTISGTWLWNTDETIITMTPNGASTGESYTIITNDGATLKVKYTSSSGGINYENTLTYSKQ